MTELERYELVSSCKTLSSLADAIEKCADSNGYIQGLSRPHDASKMAEACRNFDSYPINALTRSYGIRQQAFYLNHYGHE